jgi:hypothetical protein
MWVRILLRHLRLLSIMAYYTGFVTRRHEFDSHSGLDNRCDCATIGTMHDLSDPRQAFEYFSTLLRTLTNSVIYNGSSIAIFIRKRTEGMKPSDTFEETAARYHEALMDILAYAHEHAMENPYTAEYIINMLTPIETYMDGAVMGDMAANTSSSTTSAEVLPEKQSGDELFEWRVSSFEELGFTKPEARRLAQAKTSTWVVGKDKKAREYVTPVSYERVRKMREAGCTHKMIERILA